MGGVGTFGVVACVQEVTVTPGELLADAELIHCTRGACEKDEEEAIRKAVNLSTTARRETVIRAAYSSGGFREWKLELAKAHYLQGPVAMGEPHI